MIYVWVGFQIFFICTYNFVFLIIILGENLLDPKKKSYLKPVFLLHTPFLLPCFFRREEKKGGLFVAHLVIDPIDFNVFLHIEEK